MFAPLLVWCRSHETDLNNFLFDLCSSWFSLNPFKDIPISFEAVNFTYFEHRDRSTHIERAWSKNH